MVSAESQPGITGSAVRSPSSERKAKIMCEWPIPGPAVVRLRKMRLRMLCGGSCANRAPGVYAPRRGMIRIVSSTALTGSEDAGG